MLYKVDDNKIGYICSCCHNICTISYNGFETAIQNPTDARIIDIDLRAKLRCRCGHLMKRLEAVEWIDYLEIFYKSEYNVHHCAVKSEKDKYNSFIVFTNINQEKIDILKDIISKMNRSDNNSYEYIKIETETSYIIKQGKSEICEFKIEFEDLTQKKDHIDYMNYNLAVHDALRIITDNIKIIIV